jgi:multidrug efflux pump subunit AcrA (membrane-fusion protein)
MNDLPVQPHNAIFDQPDDSTGEPPDEKTPHMMSLRQFKMFLFAAAIGTSAWYGWSVLFRPDGARSEGARSAKAKLNESDEFDDTLNSETPRIFAGGTVEGAQREIPLRFEVAGRLKELHVRAGDFVEKGSVLAELDAELWELKFAESGTLLKLARAERVRLVRAGNSAVRKEDLTIADAKVALAEGTVRRERLMLDKTLLRAPTDGIVLRVQAEPGEMVGPEDNRDLFTLVNRSSTRVRACVEELDAMNVAVGQKTVVIADGRPDKSYAGTVHSCSPFVAPKVQRHLKPGEMVDVRVREVMIELADGSDLLIGLPVEVFIERGPIEKSQAKIESSKSPRSITPGSITPGSISPGSSSSGRPAALRSTPQHESPRIGQKVRRPSSRFDSIEAELPTDDQQSSVERTSDVGEWREPTSRE